MSLWSSTRISLTGLATELLLKTSHHFFCLVINRHVTECYRDLVQLLGGAIAGLHSMTDEHFGISVVEYMAAGAIPIGK